MNDSQVEPIQPERASSLPTANSESVLPAKRRKQRILIVGALVAAGLLLCVVLCIAAFGTGIIKATVERNDVEQVVDEFMSAMAERDIDKAYALLSTRAKGTVPRSKLEELQDGNNFALFEGYRSVQIANIDVSTTFRTDPDLPRGIVANVKGQVIYKSGYSGHFDAILEQENNTWRIFSINITIPPDKIGE